MNNRENSLTLPTTQTSPPLHSVCIHLFHITPPHTPTPSPPPSPAAQTTTPLSLPLPLPLHVKIPRLAARLHQTLLPTTPRRLTAYILLLALILCLKCTHPSILNHIHTNNFHYFTTYTHLKQYIHRFFNRLYQTATSYDWRGTAAFHVTSAMRASMYLSLLLGLALGGGVGLLSGCEPAVVIGVSASMAMGCVFVMSFAVLHGVNALRAIAFALFVSVCLPFGFGLGFGIGVLLAVFVGLEDGQEVRDKASDFIRNFGDFVRVVAAFTLEIL